MAVHSQKVVHGDLTSVRFMAFLKEAPYINSYVIQGNVLISEGTAALSDFGLSRVVGELPVYPSTNNLGTTRWAAPELFCFENDEKLPPPIEPKCDVYSYGCIVHEVRGLHFEWLKHTGSCLLIDIAFQVISTKVPYYNIKVETLIILEKMNRTTPNRPLSPLLTDNVWDFIRLCWRDPIWRPDAAEVAAKLKELVHQYSQEELVQIWPAEVDPSGN